MSGVDKQAYDEFYERSVLADEGSPEAYAAAYEAQRIAPLHAGGTTKGFVRGQATRSLIEAADASGRPRNELHVVDCGCGAGELSVYLATQGFRVTGVDVSSSACAASADLAGRIGVAERCRFLPESLEELSLDDATVDFVIGHGALHHFIKYPGVPAELRRVMRPGAQGWFADSYGENPAYRLFHDRERMERLGDVILTRDKVLAYFSDFEVDLYPADWFVMFDKLYLRVLPERLRFVVRVASRVHFALDRHLVPADRRIALFFTGSVVTRIRRP